MNNVELYHYFKSSDTLQQRIACYKGYKYQYSYAALFFDHGDKKVIVPKYYTSGDFFNASGVVYGE